jgi:hypothetical protein
MKLTDLSDCNDHLEALAKLTADFKAEKVDLFMFDNTNTCDSCGCGTPILNPTHSAVRRADTLQYLWTHGRDYGMEQYTEEFSRLDAIMSNGALSFTDGYMLGIGEKVLINLTDGNYIDLWDKLRIKCYYTVRSSKDGVWRWSLSCTPFAPDADIRLTLPNLGSSVRRKHSKFFTHNMNKDKADLVRAKLEWQNFESLLVEKRIQHVRFNNTNTIEDYLKAVIGGESDRAQETRDKIISIFKGVIVKMYPAADNTVCGAYIATALYYDRLSANKRKRLDAESADIEMKLSGSAAKGKAIAFNKMVFVASRILGVQF